MKEPTIALHSVLIYMLINMGLNVVVFDYIYMVLCLKAKKHI